jgi:hypothetical protein
MPIDTGSKHGKANRVGFGKEESEEKEKSIQVVRKVVGLNPASANDTVCFRDLAKLNLPIVVRF